jgi:amidohydrolase
MSREVPALESGVLSLCKIEAGTAGNILPENVYLTGTVRAFTKEVNQQILDAAKRITEGTAAMLRGSATFEAPPGLPPVFNTDAVYATLRRAFEHTFEDDMLIDLPHPSMGAEDFSFFLEHAPGGHFRVGVGFTDKPNHPLHSPNFVVDESCLQYGAAALAALALEELGCLK